MKRLHILLSLLAALAALSSCSGDRFKLKGEIYDAAGRLLTLEKAGFDGSWVVIDSTRVSKTGAFSFSCAAPAAPEVYRLRLDTVPSFVYFPVEQKESLTLTSSASDFGVKYTLDGSEQASRMAAFDSELVQMTRHLSHPDSAKAFKRRVFGKYMQDGQGDITSYYVLTKTLGETPLFDSESDADYPYFAAVATAFKEFRPDDPHTRLLEATTLRMLKDRNARKGRQNVVQAPETGYIEITLPGTDGAEKALSASLGKGKPTILVFSMLGDPATPAENRVLAAAYPGVEIYQVGMDDDQYSWRDAASNLPWTNVYDGNGPSSKALASYNVGSLPTYFIFDSTGSLKARATSAKEAVAKAR